MQFVHHDLSERRTMNHIDNKAFPAAYNKRIELCNNDELEKCIEKAQENLEDGGNPRYHRMQTWILLECCHEDWAEADDCYS